VTSTAPPPARWTAPPPARWSAPLPSARYDATEHVVVGDVPQSVAIPAIGVDAPVRAVGVFDDGRLEVPPADVVGWYRFGSSPGEPGSTVLAAHVAYDGRDGAFRHLASLIAGDEVVVDGARFVVERVEQYRKEALPDAVWAGDGPARLVLITCGGSFDAARRSYDSNVVAWTRPA
jgi:sortase (surface protein transpeptidase)